MKREACFLFVTDSQQARLLRCGQSASGNAHLDEVESYQHEWTEKEHGRPSPLSRRGIQAYGDKRERENLERLASAARQWGKTIEQIEARERPDRLLVLAPVRLLPLIEQHTKKRAAAIDWEASDLAPLSAGELAVHPRVLRWLQSGHSNKEPN